MLGLDVTLQNNLTCKLEYRTTRVLTLSMTSVQLNEATSKDWVFGAGYKINNFNFNMLKKNRRAVRNRSRNNQQQTNTNNKKNNNNTKSTFNHDLNLRLDVSLRKQAAITRDIASRISTATSGNEALKISFAADYTISKLLTMSFYYDRQTNTPLLSSNSYPTTTRDFGLSLKFSLTR